MPLKTYMMNLMNEAIKLAILDNPWPNPRVGALIEKDGRIIGKGWHKKAGGPHAERMAISDAGGNARGSTLYITLEPCSHICKRTPPCTDAIIKAGISKVVYGMNDPNPLVNGAQMLEKAGIMVAGPVNEKACYEINKRYFERFQKPLVVIKMAASLDGRTATRSGDSKWISSLDAREVVHALRSEYDAVMVGAGTVRSDDPRLTARIKDGRDPIRVILGNEIPNESKVLINPDKRTIIATTEENQNNFGGLDVIRAGKGEVDVEKIIHGLGKAGIRSIMVEGGSKVNASLLKAGVVDKLLIFISPILIGEGPGIFADLGVNNIHDAKKIRKMKTKRIGDDILVECLL